MRNQNKPLSLRIVGEIYRYRLKAITELSNNDKNFVTTFYQQFVTQINNENQSDEYYLKYENESLIGILIKNIIDCNDEIFSKTENKMQCCLAFGQLITQMINNKIYLIKQVEIAHKKLEEQQLEQNQQQENIENLISARIRIGLTCVHDDVTIMVKFYLESYIKCVSTKHQTIYY